MALIEKLSAIGEAIRAKTGKTDLLTLDEMPTEIAAIETGSSDDGYDFTTLHTVTVSNLVNSNTQDLSDYLDGTEKVVAIRVYGYPSGYSGATRYRLGINCYMKDDVRYFQPMFHGSYSVSGDVDVDTQDYIVLTASNKLSGYTVYNSKQIVMRITKMTLYYYAKEEA